MFHQSLSVIKYAPKVQVVPNIEAEPTDEDYVNLHKEHWADIFVIPEEDGKTNIIKDNKIRNDKEWYVCKLCPYQSETKDLLMKHMKRKHTFIDDSDFVCNFCNMRLKNEDILEQHLQLHLPEKEYVDDSWKREFLEEEVPPLKPKRFSKEARDTLDQIYEKHKYIASETKMMLAKKFNVDKEKIHIWFKNRRRYERRKGK